MPFVKGVSGNPNGRRGDYQFQRQIERALAEPLSSRNRKSKLERAADVLVNQAIKGKAWAMLELINRVDGKVADNHDHTLSMSDQLVSMFKEISERTNKDGGGYGGILIEHNKEAAE